MRPEAVTVGSVALAAVALPTVMLTVVELAMVRLATVRLAPGATMFRRHWGMLAAAGTRRGGEVRLVLSWWMGRGHTLGQKPPPSLTRSSRG